VNRIRYSVMTRLALDPRTDPLVESYPPCGMPQDELVALGVAQEPRSPRIAHHTRASRHVIAGIRLGVPALVLIREPEAPW
jgi:hypothetical protein